MNEVLIIAIIVSGFVSALYLFLKHIKNLELLSKASDLVEYKHYEIKQAPVLPPDEPESLVEVLNDLNPQDIRKAF